MPSCRLPHKIRNEVHAAVGHLLQFQLRAEFLTFSQYLHPYRQRFGLAVVEQFFKALRCHEVITGQAVLRLELVPVDLAFVYGLVAPSFRLGLLTVVGLLSVFLFHFFLIFLLVVRLILSSDFIALRFCHRLFVGGGVHLVRGEQAVESCRLFDDVLDDLQEFLRLICRYAVEAEARGIFVLTEEILEEVVYDIAVAVECHEVL